MYLSQQLKYHVYLENIEIDFSNITINEANEQTPTATISIVPVNNIFNILPKTICVITCDMASRDSSGMIIQNKWDELVIFFGELCKYGMSRTPTSVEIQLTFVGFTNDWNSTTVTPADIGIDTITESVLLGFNPAVPDGTGINGGFFYSNFPAPVIEFSNLLSTGIIGDGLSVAKNIGVDTGRNIARNSLNSNASIPATTADKQTGLKTALQITVKHFLLNYGIFLHSLTKSLSFDTMINYIGSNEFQELIKTNSTMQYIANGMKASSGSGVISQVLKGLFQYFNYTYTEFAAPIICPDSSKPNEMILSKVLVHPDMSFFAPISNNVFFDDDIVTMNFGRDLDAEPTRGIYMSNMLTLGGGTDNKQNIFPMLLATIVPGNIVLGTVVKELNSISPDTITKANNNTNDTNKAMQDIVNTSLAKSTDSHINDDDKLQYETYSKMVRQENTHLSGWESIADKTIKILKLSPEEIIRGIVPEIIQDTNGMETAFILDTSKSVEVKKLLNYYQDNSDTGAGNIKSEDAIRLLRGANGPMQLYAAKFSIIKFREARRRNRVINMTTTYSPFRVCGANSLIFIKDVGPMVGVLQQINTNISANGEATQHLSFSHASILNTISAVSNYATALDAFDDVVLDYEREFDIEAVGEALYAFLSGRENSSVNDFYENEINTNPATRGKTTASQAKEILDKYGNMSNLTQLAAFIYRLTYRRLATKTELLNVITQKTRAAATFIGTADGPHPFVTERQTTIKNIFNNKSANSAWSE